MACHLLACRRCLRAHHVSVRPVAAFTVRYSYRVPWMVDTYCGRAKTRLACVADVGSLSRLFKRVFYLK